MRFADQQMLFLLILPLAVAAALFDLISVSRRHQDGVCSGVGMLYGFYQGQTIHIRHLPVGDQHVGRLTIHDR